MAINADLLLDRLQLKSQVSKWRLMALLFGLVVLALLIDTGSGSHSPMDQPYIARVTLEGIIDDNRNVYEMLEKVADNPKVEAVIVWLNTPGGNAVAGEEIYKHMRAISERKPVVAVMRSVSASAGYMIAIGADHIIAREGTLTGSIGVLLESAEFTDLAEKIGVTPIIVRSGPLKAAPNPLEEVKPEALAVLQQAIDDFHIHFVDMVATRRSLPREQVALLADGRIYSGQSALNNKLIDQLGGEEEAIQWLEEKRQVSQDLPIKDVKPKEEDKLVTRFLQGIGVDFLKGRSVTLDGIRAIWHPAL